MRCLVRLTILGGLLLSACVPKSTQPAEPAGVAPAVEPAPAEATHGVYGEVPGTEVLDAGGIELFQVHGATEKVEVSTVAVTGQPFAKALRAKVKTGSQNNWDVQLQTPIKQAVQQGDVMLASFYLRTDWVADESGEGQTEFVFELAKEPWTKSVTYPVRASRDWKLIQVPFVAGANYQPGEAQAIFRLGYSPETIEIGGVKVENFGKRLALADLPTTKITYPGMGPDAPWRAAAQERIDQHRKAELKVSVSDAAGKPLVGAEVSLRQRSHGFKFGTCVAANKLVQPGNDQYKAAIKDNFNIATVENSFKWVPLEGEWGSSFSLEIGKGAVDWLGKQGLETRGHVLIWPGWKNLPKSLKALEKEPEQLRRKVRAHIKELATATKGSLVHWDVMNEPFDNHDLIDILGKQEMVEWFKIARAADPKAKLYINDYAILSGGGGDSPHRKHYEETIQFLIDKGAPLDGIGLQGHFGTSLTAPEDVLALLDRYAKFNKPLLITEYDVVVDDEALGARYTEDFYTALFSHPAVEGVIMWGFWDSVHWKKNSPMYRSDWSLKPSGQTIRDLLHQRWRTEVQGKTDASGVLVQRGFLGDYEVTVKHGDKSTTRRLSLLAKGAELKVKLD